jgi:hypothetical protein
VKAGFMRTRVYVVALGFLLLVICVGSLAQVIISERYKMTETAAGAAAYSATAASDYRTRTAVFWALIACEEISGALGMSHVCGDWYDSRTLPPSPTDPAQPTLTGQQATATSIRRTEMALERVLTACSTLRDSAIQDIDPCPTFWTAVARSSTTRVAHTPAD